MEFKDEVMTVKKFFSEEDEFIRARINNLCKLMAKQAGLKFADVVNMPYSEWQDDVKRFNEKYGIKVESPFLVK